MASATLLQAQQAGTATPDTLTPDPEIITLADISIRSGEVFINTKKIVELLISEEEIEMLRVNNDSLLLEVDSLLALDNDINFQTKNIRYLENKLAFWTNVAVSLGNEKSSLADLVHDLEEQKYDLEHEMMMWKNTKILVEKEESAGTAIHRIDELIFQLDSVKTIIWQKSRSILILLDQTTKKGLTVNDHNDAIDENVLKKEEAIFEQNQLPIWRIQLASGNSWQLKDPLKQFFWMEVRGLKLYINKYIPNLIFQIILLISLMIAFPVIKRRLMKSEINESSFYQRILVRILFQPISAALILGLFASVLIFPNRPILFKDISRIIIAIPLIIIATNLVDRKFYKYFYIFGFLLLFQFFSFVFPPGHGLYLLNLIAVAVIELIFLFGLFRFLQTHPIKRKFLYKLLVFLLILHMGFAFTGLLGVISGAIILAEMTLNVTIINALAGILIVISALLLNGLIEAGIESKSLQKLNIFRLHGNSIKRKFTELLNFSAVFFWLFTMLQVIKIDRPVVEGITSFFTNDIRIGSVSFTLGRIVTFFLVIWLSIVISKMIRVILEQDVLNKLSLAKGLPHTISVMVRYSLVTVGVLLAVSAAGLPLDSLTILFGAFGVGIGFGLQNIFNNLVSGFILLFERPIQIGDTIEVGELMGNVKSIGIRSSNIRTFDGAEVIVPNGQLISNEVVNWTLSDQKRRIEVLAGIAYGSDPHKVKELFEKMLADHPDVIQVPEPKVFFNDLGESSLDFRLLFWTSNFDDWIRIRSEIIFKVHDVLKENNIEIPFPQQDLHLRSVDQHIGIFEKEG